jgi:hypothetical protein
VGEVARRCVSARAKLSSPEACLTNTQTPSMTWMFSASMVTKAVITPGWPGARAGLAKALRTPSAAVVPADAAPLASKSDNTPQIPAKR